MKDGKIKFPKIKYIFGNSSYKNLRVITPSEDKRKYFKLEAKKIRNSIDIKKKNITTIMKKFNNSDKNQKQEQKSGEDGKFLYSPSQKNRIEQYKISKKEWEAKKDEYIKGKKKNLEIKLSIKQINEDLNNVGKKIDKKKEDINGMKNKIKISENHKNVEEDKLKQLQNQNEKLEKEIIEYLKKKLVYNKKRLEEKNKVILDNEEEIKNLKNKMRLLINNEK